MLGNAYFGEMPLAAVRRSTVEHESDDGSTDSVPSTRHFSSARTRTSARQPPDDAPLDYGTMAAPATTTSEYGSDVDLHAVAALSDYGSDIGFEDIDEDTILADALNTIEEARPSGRGAVLPSIEFEEGEQEDEEHDVAGFVPIHGPTLLRLAKRTGGAHPSRGIQSSPVRQTLEVEYHEPSRRAFSGTWTAGSIA